MEKLTISCVLCFIVLFASQMSNANELNGATEGPDALRKWYRRLPAMKQKVSQLHFYLHDIVGGPNATNIPVAMANSTSPPTFFGLIGAMDDLLTAGSSPDSETIGRSQGLIVSSSLEEVAYHMTLSFVFTTGKFNGSKFTVAGHNPFMNEYRELPIIGGSGAFRLATGSVLLHNLVVNSTSGDAVVEYNAMILHY